MRSKSRPILNGLRTVASRQGERLFFLHTYKATSLLLSVDAAARLVEGEVTEEEGMDVRY